jgi:hypothetical protein
VRVTGTKRDAATHDWGTVDRFEIANKPVSGTNYRIVNRHSGKPLAVADGSTADAHWSSGRHRRRRQGRAVHRRQRRQPAMAAGAGVVRSRPSPAS